MRQLQVRGRRDALLHQQGPDRGEPPLVVRRAEVLLHWQPLLRVAELVEVVDAALDQCPVEREDVRLPVGVEGRLVGFLDDRGEPGHPADVVDATHVLFLPHAVCARQVSWVPARATRPPFPPGAAMTATDAAPRSPVRVIVASLIGTSLEWYDFFLYSTAAALVFNRLFFPDVSPVLGPLLAFTTA